MTTVERIPTPCDSSDAEQALNSLVGRIESAKSMDDVREAARRARLDQERRRQRKRRNGE